MTIHETWEQTARRYLDADDVSFWMKRAIRDLLLRDPVDAINDVEMLRELMEARSIDVLERAKAMMN